MPRLLDLFCGAGGAGTGYHRAGFEVVGVDINPQPNYPFEFHQLDALSVLEEWTNPSDYAAIHASPPCQDYSKAMRHLANPKPRLLDPVRKHLTAIGLPYVIENVVGAPLPTSATLDGRFGVELCGTMFGLRVYRHRLFETTFPISAPTGCSHDRPAMNPHNQAGRDLITAEFGSGDQERPWREEMGVSWMNRQEARESIPPAYTEYVGRLLLEQTQAAVAAPKKEAA